MLRLGAIVLLIYGCILRSIYMVKSKRIFVVGHTGAGKALLSEALAKKLEWQFIDANPGLERYIGRSLNETLGKQGEAAFHQCEAEIISLYAGKENVVVLLEEAVIATEQNRKLLSSEFVVYLKVSTSVQMERWPNGRSSVLPIADLKAFLDKQHLERDHLFEEVATLTIEPTSLDDAVNKITKALDV